MNLLVSEPPRASVSRPTLKAGGTLVVVAALLVGCTASDEPLTAPSSEPASSEPAPPAESASPSEAARPFEGATIELMVGADPGGSFDDAARMLQPYLEETTGATVVIQNMPGGGTLIATNFVWAAEPDGLTIGTLNGPGATVSVITETAEDVIEFEIAEFSYLAGLTAEPRIMTVGPDSPFETFEDMLASDEPIRMGTVGASGSGYNDAIFLQNVFGDQVQFEIVTAFEGGGEVQLALIRGDIHASTGLLGGELAAIEAGEVRGLVVMGDERSDLLPDVPAVTEFDLSPEVLELFETHITISQLGIILVAPPDMPDDLLGPLQDAAYAAASDPELVAEAESRGVRWFARDSEAILEALSSALDAPTEYVEFMRAGITQ